MVILPPVDDRKTLTYKGVTAVVKNFAATYILPTDQTFAFVVGDQQVFIITQKITHNHPKLYLFQQYLTCIQCAFNKQ